MSYVQDENELCSRRNWGRNKLQNLVAPCSMVEVYRHSRGACCLRHQGENFYHTTWRNNPEDSHLQEYQLEVALFENKQLKYFAPSNNK
jgi:hypothetical protein